jgi:hypothetical protein
MMQSPGDLFLQCSNYTNTEIIKQHFCCFVAGKF